MNEQENSKYGNVTDAQILARQWEADDLCRKAHSLLASGLITEARESLQRALQIRREIPGTEYGVVHDLARCAIALNDYPGAEELLDEAIAIAERRFYPDHAAVAPMLDAKCYCAINQNNWSDAEQLAKRSLQIKQRCELGTATDVVETMRTLAVIQMQLGKFAEAEALLKKGLTLTDESTIGPVEEFHWQLGRLYFKQNRLADSGMHFAKALTIMPIRAGKNHRFAYCLKDYAELLKRQGKQTEAEKLERDAAAILRTVQLANSPIQDWPAPLYFAEALYAPTILH